MDPTIRHKLLRVRELLVALHKTGDVVPNIQPDFTTYVQNKFGFKYSNSIIHAAFVKLKKVEEKASLMKEVVELSSEEEDVKPTKLARHQKSYRMEDRLTSQEIPVNKNSCEEGKGNGETTYNVVGYPVSSTHTIFLDANEVQEYTGELALLDPLACTPNSSCPKTNRTVRGECVYSFDNPPQKESKTAKSKNPKAPKTSRKKQTKSEEAERLRAQIFIEKLIEITIPEVLNETFKEAEKKLKKRKKKSRSSDDEKLPKVPTKTAD